MKRAFTLLELVFVIVVIGILASVAIPKLWVTRDDAIVSKGRSDVATIRSAISTDRQKRLLEGNTTIRPKLDDVTTYDQNDSALFSYLLQYPVYSKKSAGNWKKTGKNTYVFILGDGTGVTFTYNTATGAFDCDHTKQGCKDLTQ